MFKPSFECHCHEKFVDLKKMYVCIQCQKLTCNDCCFSELSFLYCPTCLIPVPLGASAAQHGFCSRNCLICPKCKCNKLLTQKANGSLECIECKWRCSFLIKDPPHPFLTDYFPFDRNSENFKNVFEYLKALKDNLHAKYIPAQFQSFLKPKSIHSPPIQTFQAIDKSNEPIRVSLIARLAKRCSGCLQLLIKPEPKPDSSRFTIDHFAENYFPTISVVSRDAELNTCILKIVNESLNKMEVNLAEIELKLAEFNPLTKISQLTLHENSNPSIIGNSVLIRIKYDHPSESISIKCKTLKTSLETTIYL